MTPRTCSIFAFCALAMLEAPPAQAIHVVGPGGFPQINDALAVAQPGDTIRVLSGGYLPFTVTVGVRIVAAGGVSIVPSTLCSCGQPTRLSPPNGQTAYVAGLTFIPHFSTSLNYQTVVVTSGQVVFDGCTFNGPHPYKGPYALWCSHADVVLIGCSFAPWRSSVMVDQGSLCATGCTFHGTDPLSQGTLNQMAALDVVSSKVQLSHCTLRGYSTAVASMQVGGFGLRVSGSSDVWLTDCVVTAGDTASSWVAAVPAVLNTSSRPVQYRNTTFVGGWGYLPNNGGPPVRVQAPGVTGPAQPASLLGGHVTSPTAIEYTAVPSSIVMIGLTFGVTPPALVPPVVQPLRLLGLPVFTFAIGTTSAGGVYAPPAFAPLSIAFVGTPVCFHGVAFDGVDFLAAPTLGRVVR